jgi:hypothetical protein
MKLYELYEHGVATLRSVISIYMGLIIGWYAPSWATGLLLSLVAVYLLLKISVAFVQGEKLQDMLHRRGLV